MFVSFYLQPNQEFTFTFPRPPSSMQYRLMEIPGNFSVGTAFTTPAEQSSIRRGFNFLTVLRPACDSPLSTTLTGSSYSIKKIISSLSHRTSPNFRSMNNSVEQATTGEPSTTGRQSSSWKSLLKTSWPPKITDKQIACLLLLIFGILTVLIAWGFQQLLINDDAPAGPWPPQTSVEDSVSSARAAFWADNNRRMQMQQP